MTEQEFDILIVGGGVSGSEAAWAAARAGAGTLLVTTSLDTVYNLAEDQAVLTPPAGSLMKTCVEALGEPGEPRHAIARTDNVVGSLTAGQPPGRSVGSWALHRQVKETLEREPALHVLQSSVSGLIVENSRVAGVTTWEGVDRRAKLTALCVGSFMQARLTIGNSVEAAGRLSEMAYDDLYDDLALKGFRFEDLNLKAPRSAGSLPYEVTCRTFAPEEYDFSTMALPRLSGLYAAGLCAWGYVTYEDAAEQGITLAKELTLALK